MKVISGLHATCADAAEEIRKNGFKSAQKRARYGLGVYFWAFSQQRSMASKLAKAWYWQKLGSGEYDDYKDKSFKLVELSLVVRDEEFFDLDSVDGKEVVNDAFARLKGIESHKPNPREELPKEEVYEAAVGSAVLHLRKRTPPVALKVVKTNVHPPNRFVLPFEGWLTGSVSAYIVLPEALGELTFTGVSPTLKIV